ncbi:hypothetical protein C9374_001389 [Naegleria lovaniensis]|uniref:Uncharacterized protein n=1 Tax=Naegleria lovaniensis TaxID=51637 RepID=A0AA88GVP6_NAELO|nr:uncharacterized protein C9374_001389 [Naegleria lovaniensis]KAG2387795.1 hypothetical protein C9374_001389 [Naegleria lovaniensis]
MSMVVMSSEHAPSLNVRGTQAQASTSSVSQSTLKQLFPQYWSPLNPSVQPRVDDMKGFEFVLTERTGQRKSYHGVLQVHASTAPQWVQADIFDGQLSYHLNIMTTGSTFKVVQHNNKFCFTLNFIPRNNSLIAKVAQFGSTLLAGQQTTYRFAATSTKYDLLINQNCNNSSMKMDAFIMGDDGFVSCGSPVPSSSVAVNAQFFITRNTFIRVTKHISGKRRQLAKRCLSLDKFDRQLAATLGDRYFAELLHDTVDNGQSISAAYPRPTFWFESSIEACSLPYMADSTKCNYYNTPVGTKVCIFIHGAGGVKDQAPKYNSFKDYWGDIEQWTPQCSKRVFAVRNTRDVGWDDRNLQQYYCDLARKESGYNVTVNGVPQLKNVILFTHSQGGLVMSAALRNKLCAIDGYSSSWYSISTPFQGSGVVAKLVKYCSAYSKGPFNPLNKDYVFGYLAAKYGYCNQKTGLPYPGYMSLAPNFVAKDGTTTATLYTAQLSYTLKPEGRMCGTSPIGIISKYSFILTLLSESTNIANPNDGMLEGSSCTSQSTTAYTALFSSKFYLANLNHADTSCRNGNGWFSRSKQPCLYFKGKM